MKKLNNQVRNRYAPTLAWWQHSHLVIPKSRVWVQLLSLTPEQKKC